MDSPTLGICQQFDNSGVNLSRKCSCEKAILDSSFLRVMASQKWKRNRGRNIVSRMRLTASSILALLSSLKFTRLATLERTQAKRIRRT